MKTKIFYILKREIPQTVIEMDQRKQVTNWI